MLAGNSEENNQDYYVQNDKLFICEPGDPYWSAYYIYESKYLGDDLFHINLGIDTHGDPGETEEYTNKKNNDYMEFIIRLNSGRFGFSVVSFLKIYDETLN